MSSDHRFIGVGILVVIVLLGGSFAYKFLAPQSAFRSRLTGKNIILLVPDDCVRVINLSKSDKNKYLVYLSKNGAILMKEYSNFGILQGCYELDKKFDSNLKMIKTEKQEK